MSGVDTVRGIAYQQAQGVLAAVEVVAEADLGSVCVEGLEDIVDIALHARDGSLRRAMQVKVRAAQYTWGKADLLAVLRRWVALPDAVEASFEFLTDGRLGPSGEAVQNALGEAAAGRPESLAALLETAVEDPAVMALKRASIRQDPFNTGVLLARAESRVAAMLPHARTQEDTREQAAKGVDRLFRALFDTAGDPDSSKRIMDRQTIARYLGVPPEQAPAQRWAVVRERYLAASSSLSEEGTVAPLVADAAGPLRVVRSRAVGGSEGLAVGELLNGRVPVMLAGGTGSGKSTASRTLRQQAAVEGRVVIVAHAETYLPGRLAALAADALAGVLQEQCPTSTGAQALADSTVTLIIDGASEVAEATRQALGQDLLAPVSAGHGARIVLMGRDATALRSMLPSSVLPAAYRMEPLQHDQQLELARKVLTRGGRDAATGHTHAAVARITASLGDAAGNPMLFLMALDLSDAGTALPGKAGLYRAFLDQMAARSSVPAVAGLRPALGIVYARLLDEGRRYADAFEWHRLLTDAAASLSAVGMRADVADLHDAARRCGLITSLGWDQTVVPFHDSFADFLAGAAHAIGAAPLPRRLAAGDDQRILFSAEIGGVAPALAALGARDLPFTAVAMAGYDRQRLQEDAPEAVASLLAHLCPVPEEAVLLSRLDDGRVLALQQSGRESGWLDAPSAVELSASVLAVVSDDGCGPLAIAVRIWRQRLLAQLRQPASLAPGGQVAGRAAAEALAEHCEQTALHIRRLVDQVAPPGHGDRLRAQIGPLGLDVVVGPQEDGPLGPFIPVSYRQSEHTTVTTADTHADVDRHRAGTGGSTTLDYLLDASPASTAAQRVRKALEALTAQSWLTP
ncbi:ATP-binding protein [Kitasatospora sp. NPDC088351]|uniref:ATP-binding protein n=1 Tax=Kitasatospora sp. NPDC088351 TaxID=3155180 RepID=UPI003418C28D